MNTNPPDFDRHSCSSDSEQDLEELIGKYIDRLNEGEKLNRQQILAEQPYHGQEILEHLETFVDFAPGAAQNPLGTLGDYTLRRQIGRGGMGVVYEAWQGSMDRRVALKVLPGAIAADEKAFTRFMREAKIAGKLDHQHVVAVHAAGFDENTPYYAMEYVEGETLAQVLAGVKEAKPETDTPFGAKDEIAYFGNLAKAFANVADGLQHAHSKGVIHRDIKPSNLILDGEGRLRILDFGLARLEGQESLTLSGDFVGTPLYMSPEQARRRRIALDHRTDVYSLGATMYETICGRPPFRGKDHADTLSQIIERDPEEPRKLNPRVSADLETIVLKCLRKEPGDRYGTAEALAQDLRRTVRGDPIEARPQGRWEKGARRVWRYRLRIGVAAVILILLGTIGGLVVSRQHQRHLRELASYGPRVLDAFTRMQYGRLTTRVGTEMSTVSRFEPYLIHYYLGRVRRIRSRGPDLLQTAIDELERLIDDFPERADACYYRARGLMLQGRKEDALRDIEKAVRRDENFLPAIALRAAIVEGEKKQRASEKLEVASHRLEGEWGTLFVSARTAAEKKKWKEAAGFYEGLVERLEELKAEDGEPYVGSSVEARLASGLANLLAGSLNLNRAEDHFAVAKAAWPESPEPVLLLGEAYFRNGDREYAETLFREFHRRREFKDEMAVGVGLLYWNLGEYGMGLHWAELIESEPLRERERLLFLVMRGRYGDAIEAGKKALEGNPDDASICSGLAMAYDFSGDDKAAFRMNTMAVALDPEDAHGHLGLGLGLMRTGKLALAVEHLEEATRLAQWSLACGFLAEARFLKGETEEAHDEFRRAIGLLRGDGLGFGREIHWRFGQFLALQGKPMDAMREYLAAIEIPPSSFAHDVEMLDEVARDISEILGRDDPISFRDEPDALVQALEPIASQERIRVPWLMHALSLALLRRGDFTKALERARRAVEETSAEDPGTLAVLAEVEAHGGDPLGAVRTLEKALALPDTDPCLEVTLDGYRRRLGTGVASCESVDALLERGAMETLVRDHAEWQFFKGTAEPSPGLEWTRVDFDDSNWARGRGGFGYGLGHQYRTWLRDMPGSYTTLYVRHVFRVTDPDAFRGFSLYVWADDGFVAYLNGRDVGGSRAGGDDGRVPTLVRIDQDRLKTGDNCIAIHARNRAAGQRRFFVHSLLVGERAPDPHGLRERLADGGGGAVLHYLEGRLSQLEGRFVEAAGHFERSIQVDSELPLPRQRLAESRRHAHGDPPVPGRDPPNVR